MSSFQIFVSRDCFLDKIRILFVPYMNAVGYQIILISLTYIEIRDYLAVIFLVGFVVVFYAKGSGPFRTVIQLQS